MVDINFPAGQECNTDQRLFIISLWEVESVGHFFFHLRNFVEKVTLLIICEYTPGNRFAHHL